MSSPAAAIHPADGTALDVNLRPVATLSLVAVRLRQHDLLVHGHLVRDGAVARAAGAVRRRRPASSCSASRSSSASGVNAIVSPILGALSDRGGRRLPLLLLFTAAVRRADVADRARRPARRPAPVHVANFAYMSALIYYDASIKLVSTPATRGRTSGIGVGHRVLRHGVRRAAAVLPRHPGRHAVRARRRAVRPVRDPDLPRRQASRATPTRRRSPSATSSPRGRSCG